ncbi:MAG: hypothetical protein A2138_03720 [Deltaproteobacteria bacterium RBG_16_71_12]|nr:MAG: hypothetical protein A2138_03720 [Deltaproteobacteria bacterium RBG_16_71_12]
MQGSMTITPVTALVTALTLGLASPSAHADPATTSIATTPVTEVDFQAKVLAPHAGRVVLVSVWATYCLPCLEELPGMLKLRKKLAKLGADIVFVNVDGTDGPPAHLAAALQRRSIALDHTFVVTVADPAPFLAVVDKSWSGEVPYHAVYGRDGKRLVGLAGARPLAELEQAVVAALATAPEHAATSPAAAPAAPRPP